MATLADLEKTFLACRKEFPIFEKKIHGYPLTYLDTAATAQKPQKVIDAIKDFYENSYGTVHRAIYTLSSQATEKYEKVRDQVKEFIGAEFREEIIFTKGTTEGINLVAQSFGEAFLKPGDEILVPAIEHHSNIVPWKRVCDRYGAKLKQVPVTDEGDLDLHSLEKMISSKTRLISLAHVTNTIGSVNPLQKVVSLAHGKGVKVFVDGAQSISHMPVDVKEWDVDFFAFSGHKLYGPTGVGILYGKKELLEQMPPYQGGGDMVETVTWDEIIYQPLPLKFEGGTPLIAQVIGLGAALEYVSKVGLERISQWEDGLAQKGKEVLESFSRIRILGNPEKRGALLSFVVDKAHVLDVGSFLDSQGIAIRTGHLCSQPSVSRFGEKAFARISFGLYNHFGDLERLKEGLDKTLKLL